MLEVPSWWCRSSHYPGLLRLTRHALGCAMRSGRAAAPLRAQWQAAAVAGCCAAAVRPGQSRRF
eukprot:scaffold52357_cov69-Phaeocystis_antarctica.AAC.2